MQLTRSQTKLIEDAKSKGYEVNIERTSFDMVKRNKRGKIKSGIRFCEDGTAFRLDIDPNHTIAIRTQKTVREILDI